MQKSVTEILQQWNASDENVAAEVLPLVYDELRRIASAYFRRERPGHTLQATALVHEVYLELLQETGVRWENRAHFVGRVAHMMRRILVLHARERNAAKRGGAWQRVTLHEARDLTGGRPPDLVALDDALQSFAKIDPRKARLVELRFFGGLSLEESAEVLGISRRTAGREWASAKAWLYCELTGEADESGDASVP